MKTLRFTNHALTVIAERGLDRAWIERAVRTPEWSEPDSNGSGVRLFASVPERGGRVLRVATVETPTEIRILTAFLDRGARRPE